MKDTQHTPGPWHLSECASPTTDAGICSESGLHITDVNGYGMRDDQNQANARLIAAAPDLLDALESATECVESAIKLLRQLDMESGRIAAECVLRDARAAIAKATVNA